MCVPASSHQWLKDVSLTNYCVASSWSLLHSQYLEIHEFDDDYSLKRLAKIIIPVCEDGSSSNASSHSCSGHCTLASIQTITKILRDDPVFSLQALREQVVRFIVSLNRAVYGDEPSILVAKKYRFNPHPPWREKKRQQDAAQLDVLGEERKRLRKNDEDPRPMALEKRKFTQAPNNQPEPVTTQESVLSPERSPDKPTSKVTIDISSDNSDWSP